MGFVYLLSVLASSVLLICCASPEETPSLELLNSASIGAKGVDLDGTITMAFSDSVYWNGGKIDLRLFNGESYETVETFEASNLSSDGDDRLSVSGNKLLINPSRRLEPLRDYSLQIAPGSVVGVDGLQFLGSADDHAATFVSGIGVDLPSLNPADYEKVVVGKTFTSTLSVDKTYNNTLFINCTFKNIEGNGMLIGGVSNVTIYKSTFQDISDNGILLSTKRGTNSVSIISSTFENIGRNGIHAPKRSMINLDHTGLLIYNNIVKDVGLSGGELYHGIYTQSSGAVIWGNTITGFVDSNGISIRGDGIVWGNRVDIRSGRDFGSGIKYYSDRKTGISKTLIIADNVVLSNNLYSGIELNMAKQAIPKGVPAQEWVVNDFKILRNRVSVKNDYVIEEELEKASWSKIQLYEDPAEARPQWVRR